MRWTGAALASGTTLTTGNRNNTGNGDAVTWSTSGTFTAVMAVPPEGVNITGAASSIARFDCARTTTKFGVSQCIYTPAQTPATASLSVMQFWSTSGTVIASSVSHDVTTGRVSIFNAANVAVAASISVAALVVGHRYLVDAVVALSASPTTTNGRMFFRFLSLTDPTWNTVGNYFYDSGYTINMGTADLNQHRFGKINGSAVMATGMRIAQIGWSDLATVDTSLTRTVAETHFMAPPVTQEAFLNTQAVRRAANW